MFGIVLGLREQLEQSHHTGLSFDEPAGLRVDRIAHPRLRDLGKRWTRLRLTSGLSIGAAVVSATTSDAPESAITYASSAAGCESASGTATPPARQMPRCTAA